MKREHKGLKGRMQGRGGQRGGGNGWAGRAGRAEGRLMPERAKHLGAGRPLCLPRRQVAGQAGSPCCS